MPNANRVPSYLLHKRTGHARCYVNRREVFLGRYNSPESLEKYRRLLAELAAASVPDAKPSRVYESLSIVQLLSAYYDYAVAYYGARSDSMDTIRAVAKPLRLLYGRTAASDFGPLKLKALRQWMINEGWYRATINKRVQATRRIFRWAASEELIPPSVVQALQTVEGLHKGRSVAPESKPRKPVPEADYKATLKKLPAVVADMVQVQRLTVSVL